jgi:hypothetical protein
LLILSWIGWALIQRKGAPVFDNVGIEFGNAPACGVDLGPEVFRGDTRQMIVLAHDNPETFTSMAIDDFKKSFVQAAFGQEVHGHSGRER